MSLLMISLAMISHLHLLLVVRSDFGGIPLWHPGTFSSPVSSSYSSLPQGCTPDTCGFHAYSQQSWDGSYPPAALPLVLPPYEVGRRFGVPAWRRRCRTSCPIPAGNVCHPPQLWAHHTLQEHQGCYYRAVCLGSRYIHCFVLRD